MSCGARPAAAKAVRIACSWDGPWGAVSPFLLPSWLVTTRYYIVPFALYLLYRKPASPKVELATLVVLIGFSMSYFLFGFSL